MIAESIVTTKHEKSVNPIVVRMIL